MITAAPGTTFEASTTAGPMLVGTLGVRILAADGSPFLARTTADVAEDLNVGATSVYRRQFTAPTVAGRYEIVWDDAADLINLEELVVTFTLGDPALPTGIDLCTLAEVISYVPGYTPEDPTDQTLARLITSESEAILRESNREIVAAKDQPETRSFEIDATAARRRIIHIGDLSTTAGSDFTVELLDADEANPETVDNANVRGLYRSKRQQTERWEPVTALEFLRPAGPLPFGRTMLVTGVWGFPQVPQFIVEACAKRVILRYVSDVASTGTAFADAIDNLNLAGIFASSRDAVAKVAQQVMIR
jgi:hypothetical protein